MTSQERISRLASAVLDSAPRGNATPERSAFLLSATPRTTPARTATRKAPLERVQRSFAEAPALPFIPFQCGRGQAREMLARRQARLNRRRRHQRPPLVLAVICLLTSTTALFATSREGEAQITAWVPAVKQTMDSARMAMLGSDRKRGEISLNESGYR